MRSPAFQRAERARKRFRPATPAQTRELVRLSHTAEIETPQVRTKAQASDALTRLEKFLREPTLGPMG
jgi:hypothetical protein